MEVINIELLLDTPDREGSGNISRLEMTRKRSGKGWVVEASLDKLLIFDALWDDRSFSRGKEFVYNGRQDRLKIRISIII